MNPTNDPALRSWIDVPAQSHFPIQNLPYGAFVRADVRTAFSTSQPVAWQWRGGIGFDF